jgi:hypothetical protein
MPHAGGVSGTLPGYRYPLNEGVCEECGAPATHCLQGETDSFGAEWWTLCTACARKSANPTLSGECDTCKKDSETLVSSRCWEEGPSGPVYWVCPECRKKDVEAEREAYQELEQDIAEREAEEAEENAWMQEYEEEQLRLQEESDREWEEDKLTTLLRFVVENLVLLGERITLRDLASHAWRAFVSEDCGDPRGATGALHATVERLVERRLVHELKGMLPGYFKAMSDDQTAQLVAQLQAYCNCSEGGLRGAEHGMLRRQVAGLTLAELKEQQRSGRLMRRLLPHQRQRVAELLERRWEVHHVIDLADCTYTGTAEHNPILELASSRAAERMQRALSDGDHARVARALVGMTYGQERRRQPVAC